MNNTTIVLPSARAIRHEQNSIESTTLFLPNFITISEFISKLCFVKNFRMLDDDSRVLLLLEASNFNSFKMLKIERNFFTFTKNSSYIFKFFEELSAEMYDISKLSEYDLYGEYEEHILILQELYKRYKELCIKKKLLDKIFLPTLYKFNQDYASSYKEIEIYIDGYLTNFEFEIFKKCCQFTNINIRFSTSKFNLKMQSRFLSLGIELENNYEYLISLNNKKIISKISICENKNVSCEVFSEPILQIAFIKYKVYEFIKKGYLAENIAVVLPNEKIADILKSFDIKSNFNFAMGESFTRTKIYEVLNATCQVLDQKSKENQARLNRVGDALYLKLKQIYFEIADDIDIISFLKDYKDNFKDKIEVKIFEEQIYRFENILPFMKGMNVKSLLSLFLQRLASISLDDVLGGKITVMGLLETRSIKFDAVVIIDFDDSNVPKRSDKDMFLNTKIREIASLPTMNDRENLQKHYYQMLMRNSKEVVISYVNSSDTKGSKFLKQLKIPTMANYFELDLVNLLFDKSEPYISNEKEIILEYSFKNKKLSATKLKTFLTCKRKYYFKYIKYINKHMIPKDMPQEYEIGLNIHTALKELYTKKNSYTNISSLKKDLNKELDLSKGESELDIYLIEMQKKRLESFCKAEIDRFLDGWKVYSCEEKLEVNFAGIIIEGQIDRIDKKNDKLEVLDYKTGSYITYNKNNIQDATDFQLEFYYVLANSLGIVCNCGFYDLKESKIIYEPFLNEKLAILESNIKDLLNIEEINFSLCENNLNCKFCEYKLMCNR